MAPTFWSATPGLKGWFCLGPAFSGWSSSGKTQSAPRRAAPLPSSADLHRSTASLAGICLWHPRQRRGSVYERRGLRGRDQGRPPSVPATSPRKGEFPAKSLDLSYRHSFTVERRTSSPGRTLPSREPAGDPHPDGGNPLPPQGEATLEFPSAGSTFKRPEGPMLPSSSMSADSKGCRSAGRWSAKSTLVFDQRRRRHLCRHAGIDPAGAGNCSG